MALNKRGLGAKQVHAKSKVSMHVGKGLEHGGKHAPIACKMYATERHVHYVAHAAGSKCRVDCGGRDRCVHLAALDEESEDVVVVARLKERHASLHGMQAWMAAH